VTCLLRGGLAAALVLLASVALAAPKDSTATVLADSAMRVDYGAKQFRKAEQKLKKAIQQCGASACSDTLVARLHRDLATVYITGSNQPRKGDSELKLALKADPEVELDSELTTPELRKAFEGAGGHMPKTEPVEWSESPPEPVEKEPAPAEAQTDDVAAIKVHKNWFSLHFEQDVLVYSSTSNVCASNGPTFAAEAPEYACFQGGSQYGYSAGQNIFPGAGNHVGGGVGLATSRILVGFERLLSANLSLGARVGFAFRGGPSLNNGQSFSPLHAELRASYWFGSDPFASDGVRPYFGLSGGFGEVDGHVSVDYYQDAAGRAANNKGTLEAWRKTGKGFAGLGFGLWIPFAASSGIVPEVRAKEMLGAKATAFDASLGYAYGF
jgi:hypothetical protein